MNAPFDPATRIVRILRTVGTVLLLSAPCASSAAGVEPLNPAAVAPETNSERSRWTTSDTLVEVSALTLIAADWSQKRYMAMHPHAFSDPDRLLGARPSRLKVDAWYASAIVAHAAIAYALPPRWRTLFQGVTIGIEATYVSRNVSIGVGFALP